MAQRTKQIGKHTYFLHAIFNDKAYANKLAKINRVRGFSVKIIENDVRGRHYEVWGRQIKYGYAIDWKWLRTYYYHKTGKIHPRIHNHDGTEMD